MALSGKGSWLKGLQGMLRWQGPFVKLISSTNVATEQHLTTGLPPGHDKAFVPNTLQKFLAQTSLIHLSATHNKSHSIMMRVATPLSGLRDQIKSLTVRQASSDSIHHDHLVRDSTSSTICNQACVSKNGLQEIPA